jgi:transketolase
VVTIDGHDIEAVKKTLDGFRAAKNGKPKLLIAKTIIGKGIDEVRALSRVVLARALPEPRG